jgi:hypothetical protein
MKFRQEVLDAFPGRDSGLSHAITIRAGAPAPIGLQGDLVHCGIPAGCYRGIHAQLRMEFAGIFATFVIGDLIAIPFPIVHHRETKSST